MGITTTVKTREGLPVATGLGWEVIADVEFDTDYASSGGEELSPQGDLLFDANVDIISVVCSSPAGFVFDYDIATSKIIAYWVDTSTDGAPMAEVTAGANGLAGVVCQLRAVARV